MFDSRFMSLLSGDGKHCKLSSQVASETQ